MILAVKRERGSPCKHGDAWAEDTPVGSASAGLVCALDSQGLYWVAVWTGIFRCTVLLDYLTEEVPTNRLKQLGYPR